MLSNYKDKDYVLLNKTNNIKDIFWIKQSYKRYQVVALRPNKNNKNLFYIKRIIWLPWETIVFKNWGVFIEKQNNKFLKIFI